MDILNKEFLDLISTFNRNSFKYLVVGGLAVNHYGHNRSTGDIDFWIKDDIENRKKLIKSFEDLEYGSFQELLTTPFLPGFCEIYLDNGMYADFLAEIHGYKQTTYDECYENAKNVEVSMTQLKFISFKDLLASKALSKRAKDQQDVIELKKIHQE